MHSPLFLLLVSFFYWYGDLRHLHSFPTRRSSDLDLKRIIEQAWEARDAVSNATVGEVRDAVLETLERLDAGTLRVRSEEHTSELQSLRHLVCRLLLEKKKKRVVKNVTSTLR